MPAVETQFSEFRVDAARRFANTMIVVDDEADPFGPRDEKVTKLKAPPRLSPPRMQVSASAEEKSPVENGIHLLDAKTLLDSAMDLGLICSVVRPRDGENVRQRVKKVAESADIVCLDWEIYNDGGTSAARIIKDIVLSDSKRHGRLRLIAIYTGDVTNEQILEKVFNSFSATFQDKHGLHRESLHISSNNGLRIVCLFKAHGIRLTDSKKDNQVDEAALPRRLQSEFAQLAGGLLSSVAMATIAAVRNSTHHILGKIDAKLDGPYFHHRAILPNVGDAEEYAVDVVLSELKAAVDKQDVADSFAGQSAIAARIHEMAQGSATMTLKYEETGKPQSFLTGVDQVITLITDGLAETHSALPSGKPGKKVFEKELSTFFADNMAEARGEMHRFAILTGVRAHPGNHRYDGGNALPALNLGVVIRHPDGTYLLCLQASCDAVRLKGKTAFLFIPLTPTDDKPDHVVPLPKSSDGHSVGLAISKTSYASARSIMFEPTQANGTVTGIRLSSNKKIVFKAVGGVKYNWIASIKQRRALRTVQRLGQNMGRLGFDEFEPYRKDD